MLRVTLHKSYLSLLPASCGEEIRRDAVEEEEGSLVKELGPCPPLLLRQVGLCATFCLPVTTAWESRWRREEMLLLGGFIQDPTHAIEEMGRLQMNARIVAVRKCRSTGPGPKLL